MITNNMHFLLIIKLLKQKTQLGLFKLMALFDQLLILMTKASEMQHQTDESKLAVHQSRRGSLLPIK